MENERLRKKKLPPVTPAVVLTNQALGGPLVFSSKILIVVMVDKNIRLAAITTKKIAFMHKCLLSYY